MSKHNGEKSTDWERKRNHCFNRHERKDIMDLLTENVLLELDRRKYDSGATSPLEKYPPVSALVDLIQADMNEQYLREAIFMNETVEKYGRLDLTSNRDREGAVTSRLHNLDHHGEKKIANTNTGIGLSKMEGEGVQIPTSFIPPQRETPKIGVPPMQVDTSTSGADERGDGNA